MGEPQALQTTPVVSVVSKGIVAKKPRRVGVGGMETVVGIVGRGGRVIPSTLPAHSMLLQAAACC